jgi:NAD(P)H-flavin reductase
MQIYATATAIIREASYPTLHFSGWLSWLSPPSAGRVIVIFVYWAVISYMMFYKSFVNDAYYWERVGFRGAWISVTQVPLVYLLAMKSSIIGTIIGSSHERLNWLHRWVSRTLLVTVTIHGSFFLREWVRADFVKLELAMMPMVKYGMGAWGILVWNFFTAMAPMRRLAYEFFVIQHIIAAAVFLWLLWVHVPAYAQYNIWFAIGTISFDWVLRGILLVFKNIHFRITSSCNGGKRIGHEIQLEAKSDDLTILTIKDVHMSWKSGQHIYLWLPRLGPLESHPFTVASPYDIAQRCTCNTIQLAIRKHKGISKRMHNYATKNQSSCSVSLTGFISGPYGAPPAWEAFETLILISASTGASFTLPILESLLNSQTTICTQRIYFLLIARNKVHIEYYIDRLNTALSVAEERGIELHVEIAVTNDAISIHSQETKVPDETEIGDEKKNEDPFVTEKEKSRPSSLASSSLRISDSNSKTEDKACCYNNPSSIPSACCLPTNSTSQRINYSCTRPRIAEFIRGPVEITGGETGAAVCGGKSLVSDVRNKVTRLSDERAVHKGSGAQGIFLHVEEYCF